MHAHRIRSTVTGLTEAMSHVERARARLRSQYDAGLTGYDDLAAPGWDAFLRSRRRCLDRETAALAAPPPPGERHPGG
jgi:hypothetical protein